MSQGAGTGLLIVSSIFLIPSFLYLANLPPPEKNSSEGLHKTSMLALVPRPEPAASDPFNERRLVKPLSEDINFWRRPDASKSPGR